MGDLVDMGKDYAAMLAARKGGPKARSAAGGSVAASQGAASAAAAAVMPPPKPMLGRRKEREAFRPANAKVAELCDKVVAGPSSLAKGSGAAKAARRPAATGARPSLEPITAAHISTSEGASAPGVEEQGSSQLTGQARGKRPCPEILSPQQQRQQPNIAAPTAVEEEEQQHEKKRPRKQEQPGATSQLTGSARVQNPSPSKSVRSSGLKGSVHGVLLQHKQEAIHPSAAVLLSNAELTTKQVGRQPLRLVDSGRYSPTLPHCSEDGGPALSFLCAGHMRG